jgi:hypothetical protein
LILEHHCTVDIKYLNFADESDTSLPHNEVVSLAAVITDQQELLSLPLPQLKHISPPHSEVSLYYDGRPLVSKIIPTKGVHFTLRRFSKLFVNKKIGQQRNLLQLIGQIMK